MTDTDPRCSDVTARARTALEGAGIDPGELELDEPMLVRDLLRVAQMTGVPVHHFLAS